MPTEVIVVEVGTEIVVTSTTVDDDNTPVDPATCLFYLREPDGEEGPGEPADTVGTTGVRYKFFTLGERGTYGVTVRTTSPVTVASAHVTTEWSAA